MFMTQSPVILLKRKTYLSLLLMMSSGHAHLDRQRCAACREVASDVAENFGEVSCTECTGQGDDFELIPLVKLETRHSVKGYFGNEFPSICNHCGVLAA